LDSEIWILDSGFWILATESKLVPKGLLGIWFLGFGFWILTTQRREQWAGRRTKHASDVLVEPQLWSGCAEC
jgi:hypothetical protein